MIRNLLVLSCVAGALSACDSAPSGSPCDNGRQDPGESGVDCGGPCSACSAGTCVDGAQNQGEAGVDCGGPCPACSAGTCVDGAQNQGEAGVDCGGPCPACSAGTCVDGVQNQGEDGVDCGGPCPACSAGTCVDGVQNQGEAGVDCGGPCQPCGATATCSDGVRNQDETDVDCGGRCPTCDNGASCGLPSDCTSGICANDTCSAPAPTCSDRAVSGDETDVDCGGTCPPCAAGASCRGGNDCASAVCAGETCADPTCSDDVRNGFESDVDCGPGCDGCPVGGACDFGPDCASGVCDDGSCVSCDDGTRNGAETAVDCGGDDCGSCDIGEGCEVGSDCVTGACLEGGTCGCNGPEDCGDGTCVDGSCAAPSCADGRMNQDETDVDCGGGCLPCLEDAACESHDDCELGLECSISDRCEHAFTLDLTAGDAFTCVRNGNRGTVFCWGDNSYGQLGLGHTDPVTRPTAVPIGTWVESVTAGARHVCAGTSDREVVCWGDNAHGQIGDGEIGGIRTSPAVVPDLLVVKVAAGRSHTCAIAQEQDFIDEGAVRCWGANSRGQLGNGTRTQSAVPVGAAFPLEDQRLSHLVAGGDHTCVNIGGSNMATRGNLYCWGDTRHRQYSGTAPAGSYTDTPEGAFGDGRVWAAGLKMTCSRDSGGVSCLGWGNGPQYWVMDHDDVRTVDCATSGDLCCAATEEDGARCWVDDGGQDNAIAGLEEVEEVGVGLGHQCFVNPRGVERILCRGDNSAGQLGRGYTSEEGALAGVPGFASRGCDNDRHDFDEDGVDCGGACDEACEGAAPTCSDGQQNQGETGVDCGGPCAACAATPTCHDGQQNQGETGVDCGGPCQACSAGGTCSDQTQNQGEAGVDCGGPCAACPTLTSIATIQQRTGSTGCTLDNDQTIAGGELTIEGVVTVDSYQLNASLMAMFVSDGTNDPWSGAMVRYPVSEGWSFSAGQRVRLTGFHHEYFCHTQIRATAYQLIGTATVPAPRVIAKHLSASDLERWEGVIVRIDDVEVTGHTEFDDAETDAGVLLDGYIMRGAFTPPPVGTTLTRVIGAMVYNFDQYRVAARNAADL